MELPTTRKDELAYELKAEDVYKELRLRGYEYGSSFQGIIKADMQRIDAFCEKGAFKCHAGGVLIEGVKLSIAPRRASEETPSLNEYRFVPYIDSESAQTEREVGVREYVEVCSSVARRVLELSGWEKEGILEELMDACDPPEEVVLRHLDSAAENQGLLRLLAAFQNRANSSALASTVQSAMSDWKRDFQRDRLNTALFDEDPLRHLLDVVVENTSVKKLRVLEMATSESCCLMARTVCSFLCLSNILLNTDYTVAHPSPEKLTSEDVPQGAKIITWNQISASKSQLPEADLIIIWLPTTEKERFELFLEQLPTMCKNKAFVLVAHRTRLTPAETFLSAVGVVKFSVYPVDEVESMFHSHGFRLVGLKSNHLAALLLLRKASNDARAVKQEMTAVNNTKCDWVETLKDKALGYENASDEKIWLVASDCRTSGVVGLTNCLRRETAESRVRCIFNASLKHAQETIDFHPNNAAFADILSKDLVMNIYRDGEWGSFRLAGTLPRGAERTVTEFAFLSAGTQGVLSGLRWYESLLPYAGIDDSMDLCSVYCTPLNSTKVTHATAELPPDTSRGLQEFSGRDYHGRRVMGLVMSEGMATTVAANTGLQWEVPETWSFADASTVPLAYVTAYYALLVRGSLQPGESLLVHQGSGAVGQASISVALSMGCKVFTTVGESHFFTSRAFL
ncbi:hypothetical protein V5799_031116 [Amblyomma americanum]|uniref:Enoyl reductase (ER) domain-containing protein n=1 Tax=Amblyomma americanum TaxID=6943 RepID=A0AAQ4ELS8_AMBAM